MKEYTKDHREENTSNFMEEHLEENTKAHIE